MDTQESNKFKRVLCIKIEKMDSKSNSEQKEDTSSPGSQDNCIVTEPVESKNVTEYLNKTNISTKLLTKPQLKTEENVITDENGPTIVFSVSEVSNKNISTKIEDTQTLLGSDKPKAIKEKDNADKLASLSLKEESLKPIRLVEDKVITDKNDSTKEPVVSKEPNISAKIEDTSTLLAKPKAIKKEDDADKLASLSLKEESLKPTRQVEDTVITDKNDSTKDPVESKEPDISSKIQDTSTLLAKPKAIKEKDDSNKHASQCLKEKSLKPIPLVDDTVITDKNDSTKDDVVSTAPNISAKIGGTSSLQGPSKIRGKNSNYVPVSYSLEIIKFSSTEGISPILRPGPHVSKRIAADALKHLAKKIDPAIIIKRLSDINTENEKPIEKTEKSDNNIIVNLKKAKHVNLSKACKKIFIGLLKDGMEFNMALKIVRDQHAKDNNKSQIIQGKYVPQNKNNLFPKNQTFPKQTFTQTPSKVFFSNQKGPRLPSTVQVLSTPSSFNFNPLTQFGNFQSQVNYSSGPNFDSVVRFDQQRKLAEEKRKLLELVQTHKYGSQTSSMPNANITGGISRSVQSTKNPSEGIKVALGHADSDQSFNSIQLSALQQAILKALQEIPDMGPEVKFHGCTQESGWLVINCVDQPSAQWVEYVSKILQPWPGARIRFSNGGPDLPKNVVRVFIPDDNEYDRLSSQDVLIRLRKMNRQLNTDSWSVLNREVFGSGQYWTFKIDQKSLKVLDEMNFKAYFGFGQVDFCLESQIKAPHIGPQMQRAYENFSDEIQAGPSSSGNNFSDKNMGSKYYASKAPSNPWKMTSSNKLNKYQPYEKSYDSYDCAPEKSFKYSSKKRVHSPQRFEDRAVKPPKPPKAPRIGRIPKQSFSMGRSMSGDPSDLDYTGYDQSRDFSRYDYDLDHDNMKNFNPYNRR